MIARFEITLELEPGETAPGEDEAVRSLERNFRSLAELSREELAQIWRDVFRRFEASKPRAARHAHRKAGA